MTPLHSRIPTNSIFPCVWTFKKTVEADSGIDFNGPRLSNRGQCLICLYRFDIQLPTQGADRGEHWRWLGFKSCSMHLHCSTVHTAPKEDIFVTTWCLRWFPFDWTRPISQRWNQRLILNINQYFAPHWFLLSISFYQFSFSSPYRRQLPSHKRYFVSYFVYPHQRDLRAPVRASDKMTVRGRSGEAQRDSSEQPRIRCYSSTA